MRANHTGIRAVALALAAWAGGLATAGEAELEPYRPAADVAGNLSSIGSDTLNNLMTFWDEAFRKIHPNVQVQVEGKGSSTAPPALTEGAAQLAPMSRAMKPSEIEAFEKKRGYKPTEIAVALDCVAVYVHKDNPIKGLTLEQADALFSRTRLRGAAEANTWGAVGLTGAWAAKPVSLYGRNAASGTYTFFKEEVLKKGDFKDSVKEQPGSAAVVSGVAADPGGVGYSGIGYKTTGVRALPLAAEDGGAFVEPTFDHVLDGEYPLGRALYIYVAKSPDQPLDPAVAAFLRYALSREGQELVVKDGYGALPAELVAEQLEKLK